MGAARQVQVLKQRAKPTHDSTTTRCGSCYLRKRNTIRRATLLDLRALVDASDDAIIGKTIDGTIISWNQGAEKIYGYKAEEVLGQSISLLIPPDHQDELPKIMRRLQRGEHI